MHATLDRSSCTIGTAGLILVTGASGFIGLRVVDTLLRRGYRNLRCLVRPSGNLQSLEECIARHGALHDVDVMVGNLLSAADCQRATAGVEVIYHLAAGRSDMFADAFMNSAVTTRNLLQATAQRLPETVRQRKFVLRVFEQRQAARPSSGRIVPG